MDTSVTSPPFLPTVKLSGLIKEVERHRSCDNDACEKLLTLIWENNLAEIRAACVEQLVKQEIEIPYHSYIDDHYRAYDLLEKIILAMDASDSWIEPTQRLLVWYLSQQHRMGGVRPIEFALAMLRGMSESWARFPQQHGAIYGAIKRKTEWYWAPSVPEFLEQSLASDNWTLVERALELICLAEDTSFFERISGLSRKAGEGRMRNEDFKTRNSEGRFASAKARGVLQEAVRHLLLCKTEEAEHDNLDDFCLGLALIIKKRQNLKWLPRVSLSIPQASVTSVSCSVKPAIVEGASYEPQNHPDYEAIRAYLNAHLLCVIAEGADISSCSLRAPQHYHGNPGYGEFNEQGEVRITIGPFTRSVIRIRLALEDRWDAEVAKTIRYIYRDRE